MRSPLSEQQSRCVGYEFHYSQKKSDCFGRCATLPTRSCFPLLKVSNPGGRDEKSIRWREGKPPNDFCGSGLDLSQPAGGSAKWFFSVTIQQPMDWSLNQQWTAIKQNKKLLFSHRPSLVYCLILFFAICTFPGFSLYCIAPASQITNSVFIRLIDGKQHPLFLLHTILDTC